MKIIVTGTAGFIGFHVASALLARGDEVTGIDNLNDYYDVRLKQARVERLDAHGAYSHHHLALEDGAGIGRVFEEVRPERVVHLAAQAGVRYSLQNPRAYVDSNIVGFLNILEPCRHLKIGHLVYASTSSVYGANTRMPLSTADHTDHPVSLYAATKKSNELMAHCYSHLYGLPTSGLRFFTVYGPWGRPDMALFIFTRCILDDQPLPLFNFGRHKRDFTYIDDIVKGVVAVLDKIAAPDPSWQSDYPDPSSSSAPYRLFNIGNNRPIELMRYVEVLEECLGKKAKKTLLPQQAGDVADTFADVTGLVEHVGYAPSTPIEVGIEQFVRWYQDFYRV